MYGANLVHGLAPFDAQRNVRVVIETPRGSNVKIKYDEELGCFSLSRVLPLGVTYPHDFGFVPQTLAQDGDPLDVMVLMDVGTFPGVVITCRLLGALQIEERGLRGRPNHRLVAVPMKAARRDDWRNFSDLGRRMQQELERFFIMSTAFTSKDPVLRGWVGPDAALDMVQRAINRYRERRQPGAPLTAPGPALSPVSVVPPAPAALLNTPTSDEPLPLPATTSPVPPSEAAPASDSPAESLTSLPPVLSIAAKTNP
ncbi:inorganic diphosphatase [Haliangium sp. UPWRP_2]|uniref:inorganic diphosphatase n=1 Tax=Haliangium sp. UPWRP_2 TaxID=1931276 RepID=UPI001E41FEE3|nr:inorganic diphosphatase [Haliangium sp. UPWRP_2]